MHSRSARLICSIVLASLGLALHGSSILLHAQRPIDENRIVGVVNGRQITEREVDESIVSQLLPIWEQQYALRLAALQNIITRTVLDNEAKKRGTSVDALRDQLSQGKVEVSVSQVDELYAENALVFGAMSPDEAKQRLRLDLESQGRMKLYRQAVIALKQNANIELRLPAPRLPAVIDVGEAPSLGPEHAPVTMIEFSDFQCPYCRAAQRVLRQVLAIHQKDVRLVFKHLPLDIHPQAFAASQAAFCAGEQGRFWQYHNALFASDNLSAEQINKMALDLRL